jgi:hypothetical protein
LPCCISRLSTNIQYKNKTPVWYIYFYQVRTPCSVAESEFYSKAFHVKKNCNLRANDRAMTCPQTRDEYVFSFMHVSMFWVFDTWASSPWVNQAALQCEGSGDWEDGDVQDKRGQMDETKRARRKPNKAHKWGQVGKACHDDPVQATYHPCMHALRESE